MKIYDISQAVFGCAVFPGDKSPIKHIDKSISKGDKYNLSCFSMCSHNGTHIDAPYHFLDDGDKVEQIPLEKTAGYSFVVNVSGDITPEKAQDVIKKAMTLGKDYNKRILIKGDCIMTEEGAKIFAQSDIYLIGVEGQSVGDWKAPMAVHKILLEKKVVLLEGLILNQIEEGGYFLSATPICLNGCDGAPCRAILIKE